MVKQKGKVALVIHLSDRHIALLTKERNRHNISSQLRRRIDIILLAYVGHTNTFIANELGTTPKTVRDWRSH